MYDLFDKVFVLKIVPPLLHEKNVENSLAATNFVWSQIDVCVESPQDCMLPGRCHSASLVCDNLIIFGGSAEPTNSIAILDLSNYTTADQSFMKISMCLRAPNVFGQRPSPRLSALCGEVGKYFFIQGGYQTSKGCLRDCWVGRAFIFRSKLIELFKVLDTSFCAASYKSQDYVSKCMKEGKALIFVLCYCFMIFVVHCTIGALDEDNVAQFVVNDEECIVS